MNTELTSPELPLGFSGAEGGEVAVGRGLAVLEHPIELNRFCPECKYVTRFVIEFYWANAFFGTCVRCGDERVAVFERTTTEAA